jgi:hypothetical protein
MRVIAAGRLFAIDNIKIGFRVNREVAVMLAKHRCRMRTLWTSANRPSGNATRDMTVEERQALKDIAKLNEKADLARGKVNLTARINKAHEASAWRDSLCKALPSATAPVFASSAASSRLRELWPTAAKPDNRKY